VSVENLDHLGFVAEIIDELGSLLWWTKRMLLGIGSFIVLAVLIGFGFETFMRSQASRNYPVLGKLVDIGGRKIQIDCRGEGSPTVVLESGIDILGSLSWAAVHDEIAQTTRVCAYSRAGILWSEPNPGTVDINSIAQDLHEALIKSGETGPWVMVGFSAGGPSTMIFTSMYESEVAGLVFVDASHPDQIVPMQKIGISLDPMSPTLMLLSEVLARIGVVRLMSMVMPQGNTIPNAPPLVNQVLAAYLPQNVGSFLKGLQSNDAEITAAGNFRKLGDRPIVVLTSTQKLSPEELQTAGMTQEQEIQRQTLWNQFQADLATWSTRSRHEIVPDASHYIQFDRPDVVIKAVREIVINVRQTQGKSQ
jgi:pimeloyl-ACP methyl ester carboxylesterase